MADALFKALNKPAKITWVDTPEVYRAAYQYRTEADMTKIRKVGFSEPFTDIYAGVTRYVKQLLGT
jgi:ADP-L-glycero-D-manno-heptose 6-epimerase